MLTAKDFRSIAGAIKDAREAARPPYQASTPTPDAVNRIFDGLSRTVAGVLAADNPKFQKGRFLRECGVRL